MDRFCVYLGFALVLSSLSLPFAAHRYETKARQCLALDECVHSLEDYDVATLQQGIAKWLSDFSELGLLESQYLPAQAAVLEAQKDIERYIRGQDAMSRFERESELRRIGERLESVPLVGQSLLETTYAFFPFVVKSFVVMFIVVIFVMAPWFMTTRMIETSDQGMRYRV